MLHETPWVTIGISVLALVVALLAYRRKTGLDLRGGFTISSSLECRDKYVSQVVIENQKDRAITVFAIYLKVGPSYYIQVESFEDTPLRIGPYESYSQEYGPIDRYVASMRVADFNNLIDNSRVRKRLVLSTSQGKYVVRRGVRIWNPIWGFFRNHCSVVARPHRMKYKGEAIGGNARYVLELRLDDGHEQVVPIFEGDHTLAKFQPLQLTPQVLESAENLRAHLDTLQSAGELPFSDYEVFEVAEWKKIRDIPPRDTEPLVLPKLSPWEYYVVCPVKTMVSKRRMKKENKRRRKQEAS